MPSKMTGTVSDLVPKECRCSFVETHSADEMAVFTVPDAKDRWRCAALGVLPVLCVTIILAAQNTPQAVNDRDVSGVLYVLGLALLAVVVPLVLMYYVACARMHAKGDYILGGFKYMSVMLGLLSILRMVAEFAPPN